MNALLTIKALKRSSGFGRVSSTKAREAAPIRNKGAAETGAWERGVVRTSLASSSRLVRKDSVTSSQVTADKSLDIGK